MAATKFHLVAGIGSALNTAIMALAMKIFLMRYLTAQVTATALTLIRNLTGNRFRTFR